MRRVLCVWFPRLATDCLSPPERGDARTAALATVVNGGTKVEAVSEAAEAAGVKPGMGWGDARARCPSLRGSPPDRERETRAMKTAARVAGRYGPWVVRGMDELLVDVEGTAHLFGGEPAMLEDCRQRFAERGWSVRAAVADGVRAAWGIARFAATSLTVGSPEEVRKLPVEALRLDAESAAKLRRVGLRCIDDLASRPRAAIAERFGERLVRRLERLLGEKSAGSEPLGARPPRPELRASWEDVEPLLTPGSVEAVCVRLLERLCSRLRQGDLGARKMVLELEFDGPGVEPRRVEVRAGRGLRAAERWLALFRERREAFDPGSGVVRLELAATAVEPFDPATVSDREALWERLSARLGSRNVVRIQPTARYRPEAAFEFEPMLARTSPRVPDLAADPGLRIARPASGSGADGPEWASGRTMERGENPRPLRLLATPQPVRVERVPDDPLEPPAALRRKGGRLVRLRRARGPERIALEWWSDGEAGSEGGSETGSEAGNETGGSLAGRDYWQVETEGGVRLWLYRELDSGEASRWFVHGIFP